MPIHILGIRHHGPGSARNVKSFLQETKPDLILVEGPPEADAILQWADHAELQPPVAILCYQPDDPTRSVFYPFAEFSPEWQAIQYGKKQNRPVRFFDLPIANHLAFEKEKEAEIKTAEPTAAIDPNNAETSTESGVYEVIKKDPISHLAEAAGYTDSEKWWEHLFEHRQNGEQVFEAVGEAMQVLREQLPQENKLERLREAHMRKMLRQVEKEGFQNIIAICGAWHVPALLNGSKGKEDAELLKGLPKVKIECTWVPWTYDRLSYYSGYGAGILSPGWYDHIWNHPADDGTRWLSNVAQLFRKAGMDTSVAHIIEAVRLAQSLASLRQYTKAGLEELTEATLSVLCNGEAMLLRLIQDELIVSNKLGGVPAHIPKPPLQADIETLQKKLRLSLTADFKDYVLDLRKELDLDRSIFLHRLRLLHINWGEQHHISGKGTFKESWRLQWNPELSIAIIERGAWGNTVEEAANAFVIHKAKEADSLMAVSSLLGQALPAEVTEATAVLIGRLNNLAAASSDVLQSIEVVPPLVSVSRYGNVRKTDVELVMDIAQSMIARICVSLPNAVTGINEDTAQNLLDLFHKLNDAIATLQQSDSTAQWQEALKLISGSVQAAPVVAGYATRLLKDYNRFEGKELTTVFAFRMSSANAPERSAAWLEGFLKGTGTLLLLDNGLWHVVNDWMDSLDEPFFTQVLPLLRRTFAQFSPPERRKLGEKAKSGAGTNNFFKTPYEVFDHERAAKGIAVVLQLFGYKTELTHE